MQTIDSVSRAKAFIRSHARSAALAIVPLASVVTAHAGPVVNLPTGHYSCSFSIVGGSGGTCSGGAGTIPGSPGHIGGTSFFLSGQLNLGSSGGSILMSVSGPVGAVIPSGTVIPVAWDFTMNPPPSVGAVDPVWSLDYTVGDITAGIILATHTFGSNNSGTVTGTGVLTTSAATLSGDVIGLKFNLTELGDPQGGVNVIVTIPGAASVDFDPFNTNAVPEPSTLGLLGAGLAWLGYRWRKRRNS